MKQYCKVCGEECFGLTCVDPQCREKYRPTKEELKDIGLSDDEKIDFYKEKSCDRCMNTDYKGRIAIFELMRPDDNLRNRIIAKTPIEELKREACASGMITLHEDGINKIKEGLTTVEEVLRVTQEE